MRQRFECMLGSRSLLFIVFRATSICSGYGISCYWNWNRPETFTKFHGHSFFDCKLSGTSVVHSASQNCSSCLDIRARAWWRHFHWSRESRGHLSVLFGRGGFHMKARLHINNLFLGNKRRCAKTRADDVRKEQVAKTVKEQDIILLA